MQPPQQSPIDINIEMGSDQGSHNLIKVDIQFSENKQQIALLKKNKKINLTLSNSFALIFDLYTEPGRQKQAIEYINQQSQSGLSPLQIVFSNKPSPQSDFCKLSIEAHEGFIRLNYQFFPQQNQLNIINSVLQSFSTNGLKLQSQINIQLKGKLTHTNNNRTNVLVDYSKFHLVSNAFCSQKLINCLLDWDDFQNNFHYYIQSPFFQLIKKSKVAKLNLKMDSFRKINKYYGKVAHTKQPQVKQFKYINKGIFRQKAQFIFIYSDEYLINMHADYESEDAFIRLVKVYSKFIENTLDVKFYKYD